MNRRSTTVDASKLWGGRFDRPPNELFYEFQRSFPFDRRLLPYELAVDRAWARAIEKAGILTSAETQQTLAAHRLHRGTGTIRSQPGWTFRRRKTSTIS